MSRALQALLLALLLAPAASAQIMVRAPDGIGHAVEIGNPIIVELRIEHAAKDTSPVRNLWLVAGVDNLVNLSVRNHQNKPINATFKLNVTGAEGTFEDVRFDLPPYGYRGVSFVVHPQDVGHVEIVAEASDAFQPGGDPLRAQLRAPALTLPSMRFLDPPLEEAQETDEFVHTDPFRGMRQPGAAYLRLRPGESVTPRVEATNRFEHAIPGFELRLRVMGQEMGTIEVPPLDAGERYVAEFPEYTPVQGEFGSGRFGGSRGSFELRPEAIVSLGGVTEAVSPMTYDLARGAVTRILPVHGIIDVADGLAVDLFVPRAPVLGAPTRIKYNLTNLQTTPLQGSLTITLATPNGLFYEVQGPETRLISINLGPGERTSGAVEFTPRVTGSWQVSTLYRAPEGFGMGGGSGFEVSGPVVLAFDQTGQVFARIGEAVPVEITIATSQTLQDAQLRVTTGSRYYGYRDAVPSSADYTPGLAATLVESRTPTATLGTLRPGGAVNATIELVGRGSGTFNVVPYLIAEGFAYTSTVTRDESGVPMDLGIPFSASMLNLAVHARNVPPGMSLAPFTLALAFFVGAWTMRTRFVK